MGERSLKVPRGRTKTRFTVAVDPWLAEALDERTRGMETTRSAAVEEAVTWWLRMLAERETGELDRLGNGRKTGQSEATEARIVAAMVLEALRHQFPAMAELGDDELRRRVFSRLARGQGGA
jgi:predicted transcriptional regulator